MKRASILVVFAIAVIGVAFAAAACSSGSASGPPKILYGRDVCDQCHMIISEPRFAAAYRDGSGKAFVFDDIGDLLAHAQGAGGATAVTAWVHDYTTEEWLGASDAWFVRSPEIQTPMSGGIIAFAKREDAEAFAAERNGEALRWEMLIDQPATAAHDDGHGGSTGP